MICLNTRLSWTKLIIPKDELVLPVDIYTDGILTIDDRYGRAKLNVPGVLHIERVAKWSHERLAQAFAGRSSGSSDPYDREPAAMNAKELIRPHRVSAAPAAPPHVELPPMEIQSVANANVGDSIALENENVYPEDAIQEIIVNAMKAISAKRWVRADPAQPNTVELWIRIFKTICSRAR